MIRGGLLTTSSSLQVQQPASSVESPGVEVLEVFLHRTVKYSRTVSVSQSPVWAALLPTSQFRATSMFKYFSPISGFCSEEKFL